MKNAIKLAIEGGWQGLSLENMSTAEKAIEFIATREKEKTLLDPSFWSSLGKAMGWGIEKKANFEGEDKQEVNEVWLLKWHRFIDHLASNGNPDDFFKELLANQPHQ